MRVYHSRKNCGTNSDEWCPPLKVYGGPNVEFLPWTDSACEGCDDTPTPNCPLYCAPEDKAFYTGRKAWRAHQVFVPEDESGMWFVGDGRDCVDGDLEANPPEQNPDPDDDLKSIVTSCLYYAKRATPADQVPPGTSEPARPAFELPFLVARAQVHDALPCQPLETGETVDPDIGKITGIGEPSVTKDGKFLYFAYIRKLATGTPISPNHVPNDCTAGSEPWKAGNALCRCTVSQKPRGCWMEACDENGTPGVDCKQVCDLSHLDGSNPNECLPRSISYCADPTKSQSLPGETSVDGVDVFEFNIGVARRESWDPSVGVVSASAP